MIAVLPLQSSLLINNHRRFLHPPIFFASPAKSKPAPATSQDTSNSPLSEGPPPPGEPNSGQPEKPSSSGQGFGPKANTRKAGRRVVRRAPVVERAQGFVDKKDGEKGEPPVYESAFIVTWLGLGVVILVQGLLLSASGFLPEQYDNLIVKYLYPYFSPTVALFLAGSVSFGVVKYFQNENAKTSSK